MGTEPPNRVRISPMLPASDGFFHPVDIRFADINPLNHVGLHCQQSPDAAAGFIALPLARLQQFTDLVEFAVHKQIEAHRWLRADRQNPHRKVIR